MQRLNELLAKQKGEGLPAELAQAWLAEEYERERTQWQPLRRTPDGDLLYFQLDAAIACIIRPLSCSATHGCVRKGSQQ